MRNPLRIITKGLKDKAPYNISDIIMSETEKTFKKVKSFIKKNPYPKYEEVVETLINIARKVPNDNLKQEVFNMISEYGRENHKLMI